MNPRSILIVAALLSSIGCGGSEAEHAGTSNALGSSGDRQGPPISTTPGGSASVDAGMPGKTGPLPPAPSAEEAQMAKECGQLMEDAYTGFTSSMQASQVDQCSTDKDCSLRAFYSDSDGCWASCMAIPGTVEYGDALKEVADGLCTAFRSKGCHVAVLGCIAPLPVVWTCVDAKCVSSQM